MPGPQVPLPARSPISSQLLLPRSLPLSPARTHPHRNDRALLRLHDPQRPARQPGPNALPDHLLHLVSLRSDSCRNMVCEMDIHIFSRNTIRFVQVVRTYYWIRLLPWAGIIVLESVASYKNIGLFLQADRTYVIIDSAKSTYSSYSRCTSSSCN